jgi:hypothetical protein
MTNTPEYRMAKTGKLMIDILPNNVTFVVAVLGYALKMQ